MFKKKFSGDGNATGLAKLLVPKTPSSTKTSPINPKPSVSINGQTSDESLQSSASSLTKKDESTQSLKQSPSQQLQSNSQINSTQNLKLEDVNGLLLVRLVEARNISFPANAYLPKNESDSQLPYCVIEFDYNQIMAPCKEVVIGTSGSDGVRLSWKHRAHFDVSKSTEVSVTLYAKASNGDIALGSFKIQPSFEDQSLMDGWYQLSNDNEQTKAEIHLQIGFKKAVEKKSMTIEEFELLKVIGKGSFGKVMQVRKKDTGRIYAMKIIRKSHIVQRSEVSHTLAERNVLAQIRHPFIVPLKYSFQNSEKLYLVLAFINGGELFFHLQNEGKFSEERAKLYAAELLCALECLHGFDIIYRDLKPENILLDYSGHIALCDFGLCKLNMKQGKKTNTFCGTPEYLAPELLLNKGYTKVVDWWTLGILLYEMLNGLPPFYDENTNEMYKKILSDPLRFPDDMNPQAVDLLKKLLNRDPEKRLGTNGSDEIKQHPFFSSIDWSKLMAKKYIPPFKPQVQSATDTSNFDEEFTSELPMDSVAQDSHLSETIQQQFAGFSFVSHEMGSMVGANASVLSEKSKTPNYQPGQPNAAANSYQRASFRSIGTLRK